jgi:hypothetical protein
MDFFEQLKERYEAQLDEAQSENRTGIVSLGEDAQRVGLDADHFFIDGEKVSKEVFILNSGMEHLILDRTLVRCTRCGRAESPEYYKKICGNSPLGDECQGIFF